MKKAYITPASASIKFAIEDSILALSGTEEGTSSYDEKTDAPQLSNDKGAWSSDNWSDDSAF